MLKELRIKKNDDNTYSIEATTTSKKKKEGLSKKDAEMVSCDNWETKSYTAEDTDELLNVIDTICSGGMVSGEDEGSEEDNAEDEDEENYKNLEDMMSKKGIKGKKGMRSKADWADYGL